MKYINIQFGEISIFYNGCSSQYKSKDPLAHISLSQYPLERNYFGSDHGKSESDGELGCLHRAINMAILGHGCLINNAEDLYKCYASPESAFDTPGHKKTFFVGGDNEIKQKRSETDIKTLNVTLAITI